MVDAKALDYLQCMDAYRTFLVVEKGLSEKTIAAYQAQT
jgi:site-specific recombinase XerC